MRSIALARDLALLGAESHMATPSDQVPDAHAGYPAGPRWDALREALAACERDAPCHARLRDEVGLSRAGAWLVSLCAAAELHPEAAAALSLLCEDERVHLVTPAAFARLLVTVLDVSYLELLAEALPDGPAGSLGLVVPAEPAQGRPVAHQPVRLAPAELRRLCGGAPSAGDRELPPPPGLAYDAAFVARVSDLLSDDGVLVVRGAARRFARQLALDLAAHRAVSVSFADCAERLPEPTAVLDTPGILGLDLFALLGEKGDVPVASLRRLARLVPSLVVLVPEGAGADPLPTVEAPPFTAAERRRIWRLVVDDPAAADELASRFALHVEDAAAAARAAATAARLRGDRSPPDARAVSREVLSQGGRRMGRLVRLLERAASLDELVSPPRLLEDLRAIADSHRSRERVFEEWRVAAHTSLGRGMACLFSGPPGTGKTFAAQCLAAELGLNLYRIDLSQVVSKYIGETEKSLARVFDEAETGHGILLFDEADTLFGKRSEVKDAHDRYANLEVGYLLQRMEAFQGISILTTNLRDNLDGAFLRRLRFVLEFPMPDREMRRRLWERALPGSEHLSRDLDLEPFVERFLVSGGDIHNIGVGAAHLAAADGGRVTPAHLVRATYRELEKMGHPRSRDDFGPLASHLPKA